MSAPGEEAATAAFETYRRKVERVARAIAASRGGEITGPGRNRATDELGWPGYIPTDKYAEIHWKEHIHAAEFAIAAMPDPTEGEEG